MKGETVHLTILQRSETFLKSYYSGRVIILEKTGKEKERNFI